MDIAYKRTDKMLGDVEKRLRKEYAKAAKETEQKVKDYYAKYQTKYNAKLKDLNAGKITKQEFLKWNQGQVMIGKRWEEMRDTIATDLTNTNKIAVSAINGHLPEVYALNHNYGTFEVEKGSKVNTSYTLYNRQAVERLAREDPDLLPRPRVDAKKDIRWNKSNFNSGILQGILQGESIDKIARRVALGTSSKDMSIAMRNARTAFTGAQNAGRMDSYRRAADMGIKIMKQWSAALDSHTRDTHKALDGEEVSYNEEFSNGLMYPGDPSGEPAEVYNCRCAMIADISENLAGIDPDMIDPDLADMSFDEWEDWHLNGGADQDDVEYRSFINGEDAATFFGRRPEISLRRTNREEYNRQRAEYESSMYGKWVNELSGSQTTSIGAYSGDAYSGINGLLRHQMTEKMVADWNVTESITIQDMIGNIESAIKDFELTSPIRVYRTCEKDVLQNLSLEVGSTFHDNGFGSTSILKEKVASGNVVMEINVPAGKGNGAWINPLSGAQDEEYEFLLQRGSDYKVKGVRYEGEDTIVSLDLTGNTQTQWSYASKDEVIQQWKDKGIYDEYNAGKI